jgi:hypothetical protein
MVVPDTGSDDAFRAPGSADNTLTGSVGGHVVQAHSVREVHLHPAPDLAAELPPDAVPITVFTEIAEDTDYVTVSDGLVPVSGHAVRIYVEALVPRTVHLRRLRPVVLELRDVPPRTLWPHRGEVSPRRFHTTLDDPHPCVRPSGDGPDFPFTVSPYDTEVFDVTVHTRSHDVRWRLELDWTCVGRTGTVPIDLAGHPFRTLPHPE